MSENYSREFLHWRSSSHFIRTVMEVTDSSRFARTVKSYRSRELREAPSRELKTISWYLNVIVLTGYSSNSKEVTGSSHSVRTVLTPYCSRSGATRTISVSCYPRAVVLTGYSSNSKILSFEGYCPSTPLSGVNYLFTVRGVITENYSS